MSGSEQRARQECLRAAAAQPLDYDAIAAKHHSDHSKTSRVSIFSWGSQALPGRSPWTPEKNEIKSKFFQAPLGQTPGEQRTLKWLAQVKNSPEAPKGSELVDVEERLSYVTYLQRTEPNANAILKMLRESGARAFDLSAIEDRLGDYWGEVTAVYSSGNKKVADPFFFNQVRSIVSSSMETFLMELDLSLCRLKGLQKHQESNQVYNTFVGVRNAVHRSMVEAMLSREQVNLADVLHGLFDSLVVPMIENSKRHTTVGIAGVLALQRVANAVSTSTNAEFSIRNVFETCYHEVQTLALDPPEELTTSMRDRNLSLDELTACFADEAHGLVDQKSRTPAISMAMRIEMLGNWIFYHTEAIVEACNEALVGMRRSMDRPVASPDWSGVVVLREEDEEVQSALLRPSRFHMLERCPLPDHGPVHAPPPVLYCTHPDGCHALRAARFLRVLIAMANQQLLPVYMVRADKLAPIFNRVAQELPTTYASIITNDLAPVGERIGQPFPVGEAGPSQLPESPDPSPALPSPPFSGSEKAAGKRPASNSPETQPVEHVQYVMPPLPPEPPPEPTPPQVAMTFPMPSTGVHPSLLIPHLLLSSLGELLKRHDRSHPNRGAIFRLRDIYTEAREQHLSTRALPTSSALAQHTASTVKILADLFASKGSHNRDWVVYVKAQHTSHQNQENGLNVARPAVQPLIRFVDRLVQRMSTSDPLILTEWKLSNPSRSAKRVQL